MGDDGLHVDEAGAWVVTLFNILTKSELSPFSTGSRLDLACDQLPVLRTGDLAQGRVWLCGTPLKYLSNLGWCFSANFITTAFKFCERSAF